jgi:two-component system chemotaxis response regulator CheB
MSTREVVAIGGSLGGLEAVCSLVGALPNDFPTAVLIVLHTAPSSPRLLAKIIGQFTRLPVSYGEDNDEIEKGLVFIAQPGSHMTARHPRHIALNHGPKIQYAQPSVDKLFESVAETFGARSIGVVLTGGNCDGTAGLKAIKAVGGLGIVQDPRDARDPHMPLNAMAATHPDFVVPLDQIALLLSRLVQEET